MINLNLYNKTQDELSDYIEQILVDKGIPYNIDTYGNIWSIRFDNKACFVSHMDTVAGDDIEQRKPAFIVDGILFKINAVLGADDRAGINLILNHIENINFIFTRDEEIGCLGAKELASNIIFLEDIEKISGFIELDRKGISDVLGAVHGYCDVDFAGEVLKVLPEHKDASGILTDIDKFIHLKPGVNISVGYYNAHSSKEYLDVEYFEYINSKIIELSNIKGFYNLPPAKPTKAYGNVWKNESYNYSRYGSIKEICSECKKVYDPTDVCYFNNKIICFDCLSKMDEEDLVV